MCFCVAAAAIDGVAVCLILCSDFCFGDGVTSLLFIFIIDDDEDELSQVLFRGVLTG